MKGTDNGDLMVDNEILEIQNLSDEDLLQLFQLVEEHLAYLRSNIIEQTEEGGEISNE